MTHTNARAHTHTCTHTHISILFQRGRILKASCLSLKRLPVGWIAAHRLRSKGHLAYKAIMLAMTRSNSDWRSGTQAHIHVILNPVAEMGSLPIKGYYRFVMQPRLDFNEDGSISRNQRASFSNLPVSKLLSMNLHPPDAWFVSAAECVHDMDNVLLDSLPSHETALVASYRLDHILVTGHCSDDNRQPPAGLQLNLRTLDAGTSAPGKLMSDTLVMSNLGYFQLKGQPGVFNLSIAEGRSRDIYHIAPPDDAADAAATVAGGDGRIVTVGSWEPDAMSLSVGRRADMRGVSLLDSMQEGGDEGGGGGGDDASLWSAMGSMFGMGEGPASAKKSVDLAQLPQGMDHDTIHVFSLVYNLFVGGWVSGWAGGWAGGCGWVWVCVCVRVYVHLCSIYTCTHTHTHTHTHAHTHTHTLIQASGHLYERFLKIMMLSVVKSTRAPIKFWLLNNFLSPKFKAFIPRLAKKHGFEYELVTYKWPSWLHQQA